MACSTGSSREEGFDCVANGSVGEVGMENDCGCWGVVVIEYTVVVVVCVGLNLSKIAAEGFCKGAFGFVGRGGS